MALISASVVSQCVCVCVCVWRGGGALVVVAVEVVAYPSDLHHQPSQLGSPLLCRILVTTSQCLTRKHPNSSETARTSVYTG